MSGGSWSHYATPSRVVRSRTLACVGAGEQNGRLLPVTGRTLPVTGLVYISSGAGWCTPADLRRHPVRAPAAIWLHPGVAHSYGPGAAGWSEHWVLFTGRAVEAFQHLGLGSAHRPVVELSAQPAGVRDTFAVLRQALASVSLQSELDASVAVQTLLLLIAATARPGPATGASAVMELVVADAVLPLPVAERARRAGLAVDELRGTVRAATGFDLREYVIRVRMSRAQALLAETDEEIGRIGQRVGYDDPAYFSRIFRRYVGVSPRAFRTEVARNEKSNVPSR